MTRHNEKFFDISPENQNIIEKYVDYRLNTLRKSTTTVTSNKQTLKKLANWLKEKSFKDITEKDMKRFFGEIHRNSSYRTRDLDATNLMGFYRWLLKLKKKERPMLLDWFEYTTKSQRDRQRDPNQKEKYFITREEYEKILDASFDAYGHDRALWETLYLSGGRTDEIVNMTIGDVEEDENGQVIVTLKQSKTKPRKVPLVETPENLMRWLGNHPFRDNKEAPLWITLSKNSRNKPLRSKLVWDKFNTLKKRVGLKSSLTPHCYRKTRATVIFNDSKFDDKMIGMFFGWSPQTVIQRRQEYDLRDFEDLKKKIFTKSTKSISYDTLKKQKDKLESDLKKEITNLKTELKKKTEIDNFIMDSLGVIAKEMVQNRGVEAIKEIFRKYNVPLTGD